MIENKEVEEIEKRKIVSKKIANFISFIPCLISDIKINLKENEDKLNKENLKYLETEYSMIEIKRKNFLAKKQYETETTLHKTGLLNNLINMLAFISICITLLGTNVFDNLFPKETVLKIESILTIGLMFSIMFVNYMLSSNLGLIKEKFYVLYHVSIILIVACITVSVYFNFKFLINILEIDNIAVKNIIAFLKSILLDISISVLLFYKNCRNTLTFSYGTDNRSLTDKIKSMFTNKTEVQTDNITDNITDNKTEVQTDNITETKKPKKVITDNKTDLKNTLTYDQKLNMIYNFLKNVNQNETVNFKDMSHFLNRYDWDKAKKKLKEDNKIYITNRLCYKK